MKDSRHRSRTRPRGLDNYLEYKSMYVSADHLPAEEG